VKLSAGDVVYFLEGTYGENSTYWDETRAIFLLGLKGTESQPIVLTAFPGHQPIIKPQARSNGIHILESSNVIIYGLTIDNAYGAGIWVEGGTNHTLDTVTVKNTDGVDNNNISGVYSLNVNNLTLKNSTIHDNFDRTNADTDGIKTDNSRNIVLFGGGDARIIGNSIYQSAPIFADKTGGCITYKHRATSDSSIFEVANNQLRNCNHTAIGSGTPNTWIHHNLILDSDPIAIRDFGGPTRHDNIVVEFNTIIGGAGLSFNPSNRLAPIGTLTFKNNIVVDNGSYYTERAIISIAPYGNDSLYEETVSNRKFSSNNNCYFNTTSETILWGAFAQNGGLFGSLGQLYSYSEWQAIGLDLDSHVTNPGLDAVTFLPSSASCLQMGQGAS
jgi:hypothetical protein